MQREYSSVHFIRHRSILCRHFFQFAFAFRSHINLSLLELGLGLMLRLKLSLVFGRMTNERDISSSLISANVVGVPVWMKVDGVARHDDDVSV